MNATVITYQGEQDGLRFGDLRFSDGARRHFMHDRISRRIWLWIGARDLAAFAHDEQDDREDLDPVRLTAALTAMRGRP